MTKDLLKLLSAIKSAGQLEILDSEEPHYHTAKLIDEALRGNLVRDRSSGWNTSSIYVLTERGIQATDRDVRQ